MDLRELTVVVPTKNEAHNIGRFLASLPPQVQLIVVDDSSDDTAAQVTALRPSLSRVIRSTGTIARARHIGARAATTPWLLFTDADVAFAADYFDRLREINNCDAVYGPKLSQDKHTHHYSLLSTGQQLLARTGIAAASGSNLVVKRLAWQAVGGFDTQLTCNEDSEFGWRLARSGYHIVFSPRLVVYAFDHRRLQKGVVRKSTHTIARCTLMYLNLMPRRWRYKDWGYWAPSR
ncbi:MAG: glycosyltransferase [Caldilineaceae bacterium]